MVAEVAQAEAAENFKRKIPSVKITAFDISPCIFKGRFFNNTNGNIVGADIIRPLHYDVIINRKLPYFYTKIIFRQKLSICEKNGVFKRKTEFFKNLFGKGTNLH